MEIHWLFAILYAVSDPMANGIDFERTTAAALSNLGWDVSYTATTGDGGVDLIARLGNETLVVQCKDWSSPVGTDALQEVAFGRVIYKAHLAAIVSRSGFTRAAKYHAQTLLAHDESDPTNIPRFIHLLSPNDLVSGCLFDRTSEGKELKRERDENRQKQEKENVAIKAEMAKKALIEEWGNYDKRSQEYGLAVQKHKARYAKIILITFVAPLILNIFWSLSENETGAFTGLADFLSWIYLFLFQHPGEKPARPSGVRPNFLVPVDIISPTHAFSSNRNVANLPTSTGNRINHRAGESNSPRFYVNRNVRFGERHVNVDEALGQFMEGNPIALRINAKCASCSTTLRLPLGNKGLVTCPVCREKGYFNTC